MDGAANVEDLPRLRCKAGRYYHIFRGTWRRLAAADEPDLALARYRELEAILADIEERLDAAADDWHWTGRPSRRGPLGPRSERPYPPRMHEKNGSLYHVFRNKWRRLGVSTDFPAAMEAYWDLERDIVTPAKRARNGMRQRRGERPAEPSASAAPAREDSCHGSAHRAPPASAWWGYYGGGTPAP